MILTDLADAKALFLRLQDTIADIAIPAAEEIKFNRAVPRDLTLNALYASLLEQSWAILALIDRGLGYHSYAILRGQLEGYSDFICLAMDAKHLSRLELQDLKGTKARLVAAKNGNPYLRSIAREFDLAAELSTVGKRMNELKDAGISLLEPGEKLEIAGLRDERDALYGYLSDHSHGGIRALIARHIQGEGDDFSVVAFSKGELSEFVAVMQTSLDVILRASIRLHEHFRSGKEDRFRELLAAEQA